MSLRKKINTPLFFGWTEFFFFPSHDRVCVYIQWTLGYFQNNGLNHYVVVFVLLHCFTSEPFVLETNKNQPCHSIIIFISLSFSPLPTSSFPFPQYLLCSTVSEMVVLVVLACTSKERSNRRDEERIDGFLGSSLVLGPHLGHLRNLKCPNMILITWK